MPVPDYAARAARIFDRLSGDQEEAIIVRRDALPSAPMLDAKAMSKAVEHQTPAYKWLHFFHKWFKPVFAEFVATFILLFWACMLQPKPGAELSAMYQVSLK